MSTEYKYPMWFKSKVDGLVVKFIQIHCGYYIKDTPSVKTLHDDFINHTDISIWEDVTEQYKEKEESDNFITSLLNDKVERPKVKHYQSGGIEPIDYINSHNMNFNCGCVVKYITRNGKKEGEMFILADKIVRDL